MEPSPDHSDAEDDIAQEIEAESDEDSTTSTEPERENEESVSNLWQIVRGISQVLTKLEESNTRIVEQLGLSASNTSAKTSTTEKLFRVKTKSRKVTSPNLHEMMADSGNFEEMRSPPIKKKSQKACKNRQTRRESRLISSMKYNISRADMSNVYNMKTAEPFTYRLSRLTPS